MSQVYFIHVIYRGLQINLSKEAVSWTFKFYVNSVPLAGWLVAFYLGFKVDFSGLVTSKRLTNEKAKLKCAFFFFCPQKRLPQISYPMILTVQPTQYKQQSMSYKAILEN